MLSFPFILLLVAVGVALIAKMLIPWLETLEQKKHQQLLAATKAVHFLRNRVNPGIYTFRWEQGRMLEPIFEKRDGNRVIMRFADGERITEKLEDMPAEFQQQVLHMIRTGLQSKKI